MYRYEISGEGFRFDYDEKTGRLLREKDIIKPADGPDEYRVTRITKQPRSVFGFSPPLRSSRGTAEAERFIRGPN